MASIFYMPWIEFERGWGQSPDGCSLHTAPADFSKFVSERELNRPDHAPDVYETPLWSQPRAYACPDGLAALVELSGGSLRLGKSTYGADDKVCSIEAILPQLVEDARRAQADVERRDIKATVPDPGVPGRKPGL